MNHAAIIEAESTRIYNNRNYVLHLMDDRHFCALNQTPVWRDEHGTLHEKAPAPILALNGYCLDALDESPAGCMQASFSNLKHVRSGGFQVFTVRGCTYQELADRAELAERLIDEILKEN